MYTMTYNGGESLGGLVRMGDMYVSAARIAREKLGGLLRGVVLSGSPEHEDEPDASGEYGTMRLGYYRERADGGVEFMLEGVSAEEMERLQSRADLEYVALMGGIEL